MSIVLAGIGFSRPPQKTDLWYYTLSENSWKRSLETFRSLAVGWFETRINRSQKTFCLVPESRVRFQKWFFDIRIGFCGFRSAVSEAYFLISLRHIIFSFSKKYFSILQSNFQLKGIMLDPRKRCCWVPDKLCSAPGTGFLGPNRNFSETDWFLSQTDQQSETGMFLKTVSTSFLIVIFQ